MTQFEIKDILYGLLFLLSYTWFPLLLKQVCVTKLIEIVSESFQVEEPLTSPIRTTEFV